MERTPIRFNRRETSITIPTALPGQPLRAPPALVADPESPAAHPSGPQSFVEQIGALIAPYLGEGHLHVSLVAEIAGVSVRTVQRRLHAHGMTCAEVVDVAWLRVAARLLKERTARVMDVSMAVGHAVPAPFTRALHPRLQAHQRHDPAPA
jgi:AraC-like DNA-binding protein